MNSKHKRWHWPPLPLLGMDSPGHHEKKRIGLTTVLFLLIGMAWRPQAGGGLAVSILLGRLQLITNIVSWKGMAWTPKEWVGLATILFSGKGLAWSPYSLKIECEL